MKKRENNQKRKTVSADYQTKFLCRTEFLAREGKTVYIEEEFHRHITHIVFMLGERKMSISDYIHNVLKQHFEDHAEEIRTMYDNMSKPNL